MVKGNEPEDHGQLETSESENEPEDLRQSKTTFDNEVELKNLGKSETSYNEEKSPYLRQSKTSDNEVEPEDVGQLDQTSDNKIKPKYSRQSETSDKVVQSDKWMQSESNKKSKLAKKKLKKHKLSNDTKYKLVATEGINLKIIISEKNKVLQGTKPKNKERKMDEVGSVHINTRSANDKKTLEHQAASSNLLQDYKELQPVNVTNTVAGAASKAIREIKTCYNDETTESPPLPIEKRAAVDEKALEQHTLNDCKESEETDTSAIAGSASKAKREKKTACKDDATESSKLPVEERISEGEKILEQQTTTTGCKESQQISSRTFMVTRATAKARAQKNITYKY